MDGITAESIAEICCLTAWFDKQFYRQVVAPLLFEQMEKRLVHCALLDAAVLHQAMKTANQLMDYGDWLLDHCKWLGRPMLSLADLAGAAHISVADLFTTNNVTYTIKNLTLSELLQNYSITTGRIRCCWRMYSTGTTVQDLRGWKCHAVKDCLLSRKVLQRNPGSTCIFP
jgi:hypothetical protein